VDLSALAGCVVAGLRKYEPQRQVEFTIAPGLTATGDSRLLRQALENLLGNAWKFTGKKAEARIEFGAAANSQPSTLNPRPVFFVRDNGAGFDMAHAKKLFAPFQRLHRPSEFPGTGIGLATVQRIIFRHGGEVWAKAELDQGATFHFTLPAGKG
jgi:signal transduction histidine kinase